MNPKPTQVHSLCPACSECPTVEIYADGTVRIGEAPNTAILARSEWNELVRAIKSGARHVCRPSMEARAGEGRHRLRAAGRAGRQALSEYTMGYRVFLTMYPWRRIDPAPWVPLAPES